MPYIKQDIDGNQFVSTVDDQVNRELAKIETDSSEKEAKQDELDTKLTQFISATNLDPNKDPEVVDARISTLYGNFQTVNERLENDEDIVNNIINGTTKAGDALKMSTLGWGEQRILSEVDLNNYLTAGSYITPNGGLLNLPIGALQGRYNILVIGGPSYATQIISTAGSLDSRIYYRKYNSSTFKEWQEFTAIERGSNANGEYVKYPDGTLICYTRIYKENASFNQAVGPLYLGMFSAWIYPMAFLAGTRPSVSYSVLGGDSAYCWVTSDAGENHAYSQYRIMSPINFSSKNFYVNAIAIGRWK